eukprot:TRINITY_DN8989_c0_g1_i20.p1 TRINITY_DN8989_c0_g1~~TRINITY_DN8989_c0_g1_i20.p1  ORF type:complete len:263 (+),score=89.66 TRINITY_DN8989_c0_g1_i20:132-920(+)
MGNDGGSIPGRRELVKEKKQERRVDWRAIARTRALYCALSKEAFRKPLMVCRLGNLFNKAAIVSALVEKKLPKCFAHIRSLKDLREAKVLLKSEITGRPTEESPIVCPLTQTEYDGVHKFCMMWNCGCIISERALKELSKGKMTKCINCGKACLQSDVITLNPSKEEQDKLRASLANKERSRKGACEEKKLVLGGARKDLEEEKAQRNGQEKSDPKLLIKKLKEEIIASAKPDSLKVILSDKIPQGSGKDDFMTRCAHRGLH